MSLDLSFAVASRFVVWGGLVLGVLLGVAGQASRFCVRGALAWSDLFLWAAYLVGGTVFGFGMILAGGCPQRSLVKPAAATSRLW